MKQRKKPVVDLDDLLKKQAFQDKYKTSLAEARADNKDAELADKLHVKTGYYSLRAKIMNHPWLDKRPASQALSWLFKTVFKDAQTFKHTKRLLAIGSLYAFEYKNPKYKNTKRLLWYDRYPLVLSLGPVVTNLGVRNIGFNLHLLPPKIRVIMLSVVFDLYKKMYRYQIFFKQDKPVQIHYKQIVKHLERYGCLFGVRMYIPNRMNKIVYFPVKYWHNAVFIPSQGYDGIKAAKLIKEWKEYSRKHKFTGNENINWKSVI